MAGGIELAVGGLGALAGGLMGADAMNKGIDAQRDALDYARKQFEGLNSPTVAESSLNLSLPELQYLQNYMEQAQSLGPSQMQGVSTDPRLAQAQMNALQTLAKIGDEGGMTDVEKAQLNSIRRDVAQNEHAREQSILQNMSERGQGGSGMELAARLKASQTAADQASQESDRQAAQAQQRALAAISQAGSLGGQMRGQEFGEKSSQAQAQDAIAKFNLQNSQSIGERNTNRLNSEQAARQSMLEAQNAIKNQQQQYNKQLLQQHFDNQYRLAAGRAGQAQAAGQNALAAGQSQANMWGGIGQGIAQTAGAYMNANGTPKTIVLGGGSNNTQEMPKLTMPANPYGIP